MSYGNYPDLKRVERILIIKLRHHGDVLLTSPLFSQLKKHLPQAKIDAFIYADTLPMLEGHPAISDFLLYDKCWKKRSFLYKIGKEIALFLQIRRKKYDLVINLTEGDRGAIAARVSKSPIRVGFDPQGQGLFGKRKLYTHLVKNCPHPRHTVERQLDVLRRIGIFPEPDDRDLFLHIPESAKERVLDLLKKEEIQMKNYIVIHPVSRWRFKTLSVQQMAEVVVQLYEKGEQIVLTASPDPDEVAMIEQILALAPQVPVFNTAGKLSLKELSALIAGAKALVCVDSVPLHIASAVKTPVVAVFGPTSEINWGPWMHPCASVVTSGHSCRPCYQDGCGGSKKSDCLLSLSPARVVQELQNLLSDRNLHSEKYHSSTAES